MRKKIRNAKTVPQRNVRLAVVLPANAENRTPVLRSAVTALALLCVTYCWKSGHILCTISSVVVSCCPQMSQLSRVNKTPQLIEFN